VTQNLDPVDLAITLMRCPSVTPTDAGALDVLTGALTALGFECERLRFEEDGTEPVDNLFASRGTNGPALCFAGHTDVVPPGDISQWASDPFQPEIRDGILYGRGTSDMKAAIAAFVVAVSRVGQDCGSIRFLITGDEEGPAINGTRKVLTWMAENNQSIDACIVGEPTSVSKVGDVIKIGRRGSLNGWLTVHGTQGHSAYPALANNPIHALMAYVSALIDQPLDAGSDHFPPSVPVITTIDVANETTNVIPADASARFNIRFNDNHTGESLETLIRERFDGVATETATTYDLRIRVSGDSFLTPPGLLSGAVAAATKDVTGYEPELRTDGGTSDARFIKDVCPVVECGLTNATAHKVDEHVPVADVHTLTAIYEGVIRRYFAEAS